MGDSRTLMRLPTARDHGQDFAPIPVGAWLSGRRATASLSVVRPPCSPSDVRSVLAFPVRPTTPSQRRRSADIPADCGEHDLRQHSMAPKWLPVAFAERVQNVRSSASLPTSGTRRQRAPWLIARRQAPSTCQSSSRSMRRVSVQILASNVARPSAIGPIAHRLSPIAAFHA